MHGDLEAELDRLFPAAPVPEYKGEGANLISQWVLLNDAPLFDEDKDGYPQMEKTKADFYEDLERMVTEIARDQRKKM